MNQAPDQSTRLAELERLCAEQALQIERLEKIRQALIKRSLAISSPIAASGFSLLEQNSRLSELVHQRTHELEEANQRLVEEKAALVEAKEAAELAARSRASFLSMMSHEIRTPLNGIIGSASLLEESCIDPGQLEWLETIRSSGESLLGLLNAILDFSRLDSGVMTFEHAPCDLRRLIRQVGELVGGQAKMKGLDFEVVISDQVPSWIVTDPVRIKQVLVNLMANAVKFTTQGHVALKVEVQQVEDHPELRFAVRDTGIGMAPETVATIFDPFVQAESSTTRRFGGTGLGLAICHQIVSQLEGRIGLETEVGVGSCFNVNLPLEVPSAPPAPVEKPAPVLLSGRVLVAEDNIVNSRVVTRMLEKIGLQCEVASDGQVAIDMFRQDSFDLILMDCQMPVVDGFEATRMIRGVEGRGARVPIIALTANAFAEDRSRCLTAGMNECLTKPISLPDLRRAMQRWINQV